MDITLTSGDPLLSLTTEQALSPSLKPDSVFTLPARLQLHRESPFQHLYLINDGFTGANSFAKDDSLWLFSGKIVEDFETGNFDKFNWQYLSVPWTIESASPYEGSFCAKSGWIFDKSIQPR